MTDLPILLLAAGQSRRMRGRDKLMEPVAGTPLLRRMARRACAAGLGPVIVALPPAPHPRHDAVAGLPITPVPVPDLAEGIAASLKRALAALPPAAEAVMILLADLPDLTTDDLQTVAAAMGARADTLIWRGATAAGKPGHPVIFARALFDELAALSGDNGAQMVIRRHAEHMALVPLPARHALNDLDTPEDWAAWRAARTPAP
ncbi:nucleotidyltransferase family protein [Antarcticimicrobium sediminis]|uniref:Nucleotidyltransferase family protein n=1 Tax=Antarcticimicrobium sediminis TaxID=2546227 RepID=A0A4R5EUF0_9RHOB|nr:nucleotidyltransferase family protein [Antarcticimicrobium sediminis]TDE38430.1 nucleotidyltransferase family protein [Antarcticimicrobium sediminis]